LWIQPEKKLVLARDIPGEKPLYYSLLNDRELVFASEIKAFHCFPEIDLALNYQAIWDLPTFTWIPQPETIYQNIKSLPPSHMLIADDTGIILQSYENQFTAEFSNLKESDFVEAIRTTVKEAVYSRLLSDVPIGCFLSGGLDSSIVATLVARKGIPLKTFTIGFEDISDPHHGYANEAPFAEQYAKTLGAEHFTLQVNAKDVLKDLDTYCFYGDQPFAVPSGLGIMAISRKAHEEGIKVLLSGDCADEGFGGYNWYFHLKNIEKLLSLRQKPVRGHLTMNNKAVFLQEYPEQEPAFFPVESTKQQQTFHLTVQKAGGHIPHKDDK